MTIFLYFEFVRNVVSSIKKVFILLKYIPIYSKTRELHFELVS